MSTWVMILLIILGLAMLWVGADSFIKGSSALASKFHVSELTVGLTIVAFGTSAPELLVNAFASWSGNDEIVFGNIIGSNQFNLFMILSITGLITPTMVQSTTAWREIPFSLIALLILFVLANDCELFNKGTCQLSRPDGLFMLLVFFLFLFYVSRQLSHDRIAREKVTMPVRNRRIAWLMIIGMAGLMAGGKLVPGFAAELALRLHISEKLIAITLVAAGTSLPELATSVVAAARRNHDIAVGNIIGSNIFNILFILPVSSLIRPLRFNVSFNKDIGYLAGGTVLFLIAMYTGKKYRIDRWEAFVLLATYIIYTIFFIQ